MPDQQKQRPTETGYSTTANGQSADQTYRKDEQVLVSGSTERGGEIQNNVSSIPPSVSRNYNVGAHVRQMEKPQLTSSPSYTNHNQENRGMGPSVVAREPPNAQWQPPTSHPLEQQFPPPPHEKSNGVKSSKLKTFGNFMRGESIHSPRYEDNHPHKNNYPGQDSQSRKDDHSRKDNRSGKDDYSKMLRYKAQRNEAEQRLDELDEYLNKKIQELERALQAEQETVRAIKLSAHELQKTKDTRELVFGVQETDDVIRSKFESLLADIRTWASDFTCATGQELPLEEPMLSEYQHVAPSCATLDQLQAVVKSERAKQDKKQKRHFIRGWTSCVMIKSLFRTLDEQGNTGKDVGLSDENSEAFERLEDTLWNAGGGNIISQRSFNDWRALTVHLISEATKTPSREERLKIQKELAVHKVMSLVHVWADADKVHDLTAGLVNIFHDALVFSQFLRQQRALWTPRLPTILSRVGRLMFDAGCMKDDNLSDDEDDDRTGGAQYRQKYVLLVISPALYKRGTMDGAKFDSERAVVPARVTAATA